MIYNLILIPVYAAIIFAVIGELRIHHKMGTVLMALLGFVFLLRFLCIGWQYEGQTLDGILSYVNQLSLVYIFPLAYMYLCEQCGTKWYNGAAILMLLLPSALLIHVPSQVPVASFICIAQCVIIAWRMWVLYRRVKSYGLKFSYRLINYFVWMFLLLMMNVYFQIQGEWIDGSETQHWIFFVANSIICTWGVVLVPSSFRVSPIVTQDDEQPVPVDSFIQNTVHLSARLHQLFDEQRIYLQPGLVIDAAAQMVGTNRTYFTRLMRQEYGQSFTEYVNHKRVLHAKQLLCSEPLSLEEISMRSGFTNASSFCRTFKRITGITPSSWRETCHAHEGN